MDVVFRDGEVVFAVSMLDKSNLFDSTGSTLGSKFWVSNSISILSARLAEKNYGYGAQFRRSVFRVSNLI